MRMSKLFSQTTYIPDKEGEKDASSNELMLRAGYIRQLAAGIYSYLPLAKRSINKIENIIRDEMNAIDGQEITMPVVHPAEIWQQTGRWYQIGSEMSRFQDRHNRDMVLAMTHEEVVATLAKQEIKSYKQLPAMVYHLQTKWRDEGRPRSGLIRVREFTMKDSYSLDKDEEGLDKQYRAHYQAYFNIFNRCLLPSIAVGSDTGMMGGSQAHEYMYLTDIGEDTLLLCDSCGFADNQQVAAFKKPQAETEEAKPMEKVATPDTNTIAALAELLDVPKSKTSKAVFMMATIPTEDGKDDFEQFIFAVVRGDMEVNETKLSNAAGAKSMRPATVAEIEAIGGVAGYASPVGITAEDIQIIVDDLVPDSSNLVAGANEAGYHYINCNYGRDFEATLVTDIASAQEGDACVNCGNSLKSTRGVEVGNIFKLGTKYSAAIGAQFLDNNGRQQPIIMGSYGIGVGRLLACTAEEHHDEKGLIWPISVAPYHVHLVVLPHKKDPSILEQAEAVYEELKANGVEVLFDDRDISPGVKFNDADLIGIPVRVTISSRSIKEGGSEFKLRRDAEAEMIPIADVAGKVDASLKMLWQEIDNGIVTVDMNF